MHTVIETPAFLASIRDEHVSEEEKKSIVDFLARNPDAGNIIPGTGGARKVRIAKQGTGKSGGYRVITFYAAEDIPVFLFDIYSKSNQENLSASDKNELRKILTALPSAWRKMVRGMPWRPASASLAACALA